MKVLFKNGFVVLSMVVILFSGLVVDKTISLAASGDTTVYITKTGECYHADGCASLRRSKIETTLQNAVDKGFRACSKCHPATLDASTTTSTTAVATTTKASVATTSAAVLSPEVEALKTYKGNTTEFNAYAYYMNNADLQTAIGANGDKLLEHYTNFGKAEGRVAK
ncbi:MAG: hypothetical protein IJJ64_06800 [Butyrivibrio sp.]|nr:hypothetical protein [Butyrivibrio sp.]